MAYDYTKDFLARNHRLVNLLEEVFKTQTSIKKSFGNDVRSLERERYLISNVLRSLAINYPEQYLPMRQVIRTWASNDRGEWFLHVGATPPTKTISGRPPGTNTSTTGWLGDTQPLPQNVDTYEHPATINNMVSFESFAGKVLELPTNVTMAVAEFADVIADLDYFTQVFEGWTVEAIGPTTLKLTRP